MANFFAIYNRQENGTDQPAERSIGGVTIAGEQATAPKSSGQVESAKVVKIEASTLAVALAQFPKFFPGDMTGPPVIVTEVQFKES